MEDVKRYCRRCLLDSVFDKDEYKHMQDYIDNIDSYIKTEKEKYNRRLEICRNCDNLINGMCSVCGCYVEMRAAVDKNYCPDINKKW